MPLAALAASLALFASAPGHIHLAQNTAPAPAAAAAPADDPLPAGAPEDDYGLMAWCYGALAGHVELYDNVLPEVRRIETAFPEPGESVDKILAGYATQHTHGQALLVRWEKALAAEEKRGKTLGVTRADAVAKGKEVWAGSGTTDSRQLAQLWMSWGLPGRCEAVAKKLAAGKK
jgi:hypothetical protein